MSNTKSSSLFIVGQYTKEFNAATGQSLPCGPIYQSRGLSVHVRRRHADQKDHLSDIPCVIASPDYIGKNPKEPNSIELVKDMGDNVMVCIKLDAKENYLYVASIFEITASKLNNRINSGRLKKC